MDFLLFFSLCSVLRGFFFRGFGVGGLIWWGGSFVSHGNFLVLQLRFFWRSGCGGKGYEEGVGWLGLEIDDRRRGGRGSDGKDDRDEAMGWKDGEDRRWQRGGDRSTNT